MKRITKSKMKRLGLIPFIFLLLSFTGDSYLNEVNIKTPIFEVLYSEVLEQPLWLTYESTNRPTNVNRGSMDFYTDKVVHTSDSKDYYRNVYDKGHLAPAATFSDNMENLKQTFSYLNCSLQNQYLNRGEWRFLESAERKWDDNETLKIKVELVFEKDHIVLPTGGHVPTSMVKHIYFSKQTKWKCFDFPNVKPTKGWEEYEVKHKH
jgi:DNA/RNA endonuclease G (NUC1)